MPLVEETMSALDPGSLRKLHEDLGSENEVTEELIATFLKEAPRVLGTMRHGLESHNLSELNRAAHSLKSTAATFGAARLSGLCRTLERDTVEAIPGDAAARVAAIEDEWKRVAAELRAWKPA